MGAADPSVGRRGSVYKMNVYAFRTRKFMNRLSYLLSVYGNDHAAYEPVQKDVKFVTGWRAEARSQASRDTVLCRGRGRGVHKLPQTVSSLHCLRSRARNSVEGLSFRIFFVRYCKQLYYIYVVHLQYQNTLLTCITSVYPRWYIYFFQNDYLMTNNCRYNYREVTHCVCTEMFSHGLLASAS